jgi:hypothetical protein
VLQVKVLFEGENMNSLMNALNGVQVEMEGEAASE